MQARISPIENVLEKGLNDLPAYLLHYRIVFNLLEVSLLPKSDRHSLMELVSI